MWICPKCKREFKRINQGHYCGNAPKSVEEYVEAQPLNVQSHVKEVISIIRNSDLDIKERIVWSMPSFEKGGKTISLSTCKDHISLYVGEDIIAEFADDLGGLITKKSAIYLPYDKALPKELIQKLVKGCLLE